ncbi:Hypp8912 [Branchiostoma lanceolatum]|uniref:Hypp8912 protein n=1 Tax=Branchiostoma lanceolatum TaxID=7740 RepID=A0A8J9ZCP5_BRALA|nr:Hypp8912 [Branchiostoma lanceolatum]
MPDMARDAVLFHHWRTGELLHRPVDVLAEKTRRCGSLKESPLMTHAMSLQIAGILDRARKVVGVVYDQDKE